MLAFAALCMLPYTALADDTILIKAQNPWTTTGGDDLAQLKHLASGVGWEFEPTEQIYSELKRIGIKAIRCINVEPVPGSFDDSGKFIIGVPDRLDSHLRACREIGAKPHIIVAVGVHEDLRVTPDEVQDAGESVMGLVRSTSFGPNNWAKFQAYCDALFEYVLVTQGFTDAEFEVGNEPDTGANVHPFPPRPAMGSRALYEGYFSIYKNVALAATQFEATHPGLKVRLGGPALAWAFTFRFGDFNWADRFIRDCSEQKLKLDFVGVHFYGNISSIDGAYDSPYPSFVGMLKQTQAARDRYAPGVPISITEWGPSYRTDNSPDAAVNANHMGAAWCADYLDTMLTAGVDSALYLVTTDLRQQKPDGTWESVWGWPSLFVNPNVAGGMVPKAPFHVFDMISRLKGARVEATHGAPGVKCFAVADPATKRLQLLVWNYSAQIPEFGVAADTSQRRVVQLRVRDALDFFNAGSVSMSRWLVSETVSNAHYLHMRNEPLDDRANLQQTDNGTFRVVDGMLELGLSLPPSSVSLIELYTP